MKKTIPTLIEVNFVDDEGNIYVHLQNINNILMNRILNENKKTTNDFCSSHVFGNKVIANDILLPQCYESELQQICKQNKIAFISSKMNSSNKQIDYKKIKFYKEG